MQIGWVILIVILAVVVFITLIIAIFTLFINHTISVPNSILPSRNDTYSLGSSTKTWKNVYARNYELTDSGLDEISLPITAFGQDTAGHTNLSYTYADFIPRFSAVNQSFYGSFELPLWYKASSDITPYLMMTLKNSGSVVNNVNVSFTMTYQWVDSGNITFPINSTSQTNATSTYNATTNVDQILTLNFTSIAGSSTHSRGVIVFRVQIIDIINNSISVLGDSDFVIYPETFGIRMIRDKVATIT